MAAGFVLGLLLGWAWFRLYPRPLGERLGLAAALGLLIGVVVLLFGRAATEHLSTAGLREVWGAAGVLTALVLTERKRGTTVLHLASDSGPSRGSSFTPRRWVRRRLSENAHGDV